MAAHVPFVNSVTDCEILRTSYADSEVVRIPLDLRKTTRDRLPTGLPLWVDPAIDGLHYLIRAREDGKPSWRSHRNDAWQAWLGNFLDVDAVSTPEFLKKRNREAKHSVQEFVSKLLDACVALKANWISVPQLPHVTDATRNNINRHMAEAAGNWRSERSFHGRLILPVIFTHQDQLRSKPLRTRKISVALECYKKARAQGVWVVDESLEDSSGSPKLRNVRFPDLLRFHEEIEGGLPRSVVKIGGPYWGMNLVLWARDLLDHPAVSLGTAYRYHLSGGFPVTPAARVAIAPIRQRARVTADLDSWLERASGEARIGDGARRQLGELRRNLRSFSDPTRAQRQVAEFYRKWFDTIENLPAEGRAPGLYQDFSAAHVTGKGLPQLPRSEGTARHRGKVAESFMLQCL